MREGFTAGKLLMQVRAGGDAGHVQVVRQDMRRW